MESQAESAGAQRLAAEVRAEMARQKRTASELAGVIGVTAHTAGRRLNGSTPFNVIELGQLAQWLGIGPDVLIRRAEDTAKAVAS